MKLNIRGVTKATWVRTIVLLVALINQGLTMFGVNPLPVNESEVYAIATLIVTIASAVWAGWKNNSFTAAAQEADSVLQSIREEERWSEDAEESEDGE